GRHPVRGVVAPGQLLADLGEPAVDHQGVLGRPGAVGPAAADLDADHPAVGATGPRAPAPRDVVGPAAAAVVEHRPGLARRDGVRDTVDDDGAGGGPGDVLDRVLEQPVAPRAYDAEPVVPWCPVCVDYCTHAEYA